MVKYLFFIALMLSTAAMAYSQEKPTIATTALAPAVLPGTGLAQHDFFYVGEGNRTMSIVKKGKVVWTYTDTTQHGEMSDAVLLTNGNVLFARQHGVSLISPDKKLLWNYQAPPGTEIHTARPIGNKRVIFGLNANPAKIVVINIETNQTELEFTVAAKNLSYIHGQFRHISLTDAGTVLLAAMDGNKVIEYDATGKEIWTVDVPNPWYVSRLKNGNTLVSSYKQPLREINPKGETVWAFTPDDLPGYKLTTFQSAVRLKNGNTIITNSCPKGDSSAIQAFEVTADKKLVWALRAWGPETDLGRSTTIQILGEGSPAIEKAHFGNLK